MITIKHSLLFQLTYIKMMLIAPDTTADFQNAATTDQRLLHSNPNIARAITLRATKSKQKEIRRKILPPMLSLLTKKRKLKHVH
jgi:hypothetical protein